jgi:hypothetical protein
MREKRGPTTKKTIIDDILAVKKGDSKDDLSAQDIRKKLIKTHKGALVPKLRTIQNIIKKNRDKIKFDPIDNPWSVGACDKANIAANSDTIQLLISIQQGGGTLTIRQARWFTLLYHILEPMVEKAIPEHPFAPMQWIVKIVTDQYAKLEQISEVNNQTYPNSAVLDSTYFAKSGFSVESIFQNNFVYYPERVKKLNAWNQKYMESINQWDSKNGSWDQNHSDAMAEYKTIMEVDR